MKIETCYACEAVATGDEHVPPKCIFPKDNEHRKNLIKVPSCDEHNSKKSKNDEYLKFVLTAIGGANEMAGNIFTDSVMRSFEYTPHLIEKFTPDLCLVQVDGHETGGFMLDYLRFEVSIVSIVRGLYFHETREKLNAKISGAAWTQMLTTNYSKAPFLESIRRAEQEYSANCSGMNPRVFQYRFGISKTGKISFCRLRFYEGHPIYATWKNSV
ncbi:MAG: hypothetical protein ABIR24_07400 [Verrucomicrobiota bacterium]